MSSVQQRSSSNMWCVLLPEEWPKKPSWMSFSTLYEVESCPRRWSLYNAEYPQIWQYHGYPRVLRLAAIEGTIVHLTLQTIARALADKGCFSLTDERAIVAMKELGGFSEIILHVIERVLKPYEENPRASPFIIEIRKRLISGVPNFRTRVQKQLSRIHFQPIIKKRACSSNISENRYRHKLSQGSFSEVELKAPSLMWTGFADLITVCSEYCEIREFKTGEEKQNHLFQIRSYALLWAQDQELNPLGRLADRLILSYDKGNVEVPPPNERELSSLENELMERTRSAISALSNGLPKARPSAEICSSCIVKHLCGEYWIWNATQLNLQVTKNSYMDLQIKLIEKHGPSSWDCIIEGPLDSVNNFLVLFRTNTIPFTLSPGQKLRLLNVFVNTLTGDYTNNEIPIVIANMGANSEVFLISKN
jgi:hypothetical protein